ncbi:MAG: FAD-binding oxidoreductase [Acidobacteriota bacterium]|nr:FAD-binding oxidoreductase [Acidobacteriota bacterium]
MEAGAELIARMRLICGEQHVLTSPVVLSAYRSDGIVRHGPLPLAAILPGAPSEVAGVVAACAAAGVGHVVRGAGTSRTGGALPVADRVLIVLTRLRRIIGLSGSELTVEAGVPLAAVPRSPAGRFLDAAEPLLGTVGGHVAQSGALRNVVALDLVRPHGTLVHVEAGLPGYDVCGAFPGSAGHAGIAVTITLRAVAA